ncbi:response regulator [Weeksellaceae bacterium KMM 9713]|uniref:Response regulator n=1 Tax=Profundicola chukchiensis TaxID=2961959 RepID=A0A9X4RVT5_9FLAO|nr:adenylate/guanylate cyclase domain-containing response regulator [Profundicola chukchiensis]MDG4946125.1 response regulator [Profundicola chukchiensis]
MHKILVVDDEMDFEVLIRQKFRKQIRDNDYEFLFAENGNVALERLQENSDVDIILTDINMPEMDGLTLLIELNQHYPLVKTIIVSAYGDMENIRIAMNRGAFDFITKPINFQDLTITIQKTLDHVEHVKETLVAIKENNILKMYVDESVLNFMGSRDYENSYMDNEIIQGTVIFIDICCFTKISENQNADVVVKMVNTYFDVIVKEIIAQKGTIDKFIGDAVMAVFKGDFHLDRAVEAALAVRTSLKKLVSIEGFPEFTPNVSIGINSGEMISGNIGSETLKRLDFTVLGDTVNVAARIQEAAEENQILICEHCFQKIKQAFKCEKIGDIRLKNKAMPIALFEVIE